MGGGGGDRAGGAGTISVLDTQSRGVLLDSGRGGGKGKAGHGLVAWTEWV